ncbi:type II toxin-antitoxin system prevent-host-death family antitoxin [Tessaracoccus sp. MC1627]|uniref:type II toxin-antitoxin system Phd/YefM family antitoxin n=1 Tax=Tessaracoccus sp. MC1627 TaxID=2760312 RepID=UPI001600C7FF|nr:type II toxin-antitoxin system prevent-host-death family antitoxin [Tessaracoccus sp. MC1627]MBB1513361.1 type II toxin-antitoxin system prevent-host-death family antitoxin [Tessaracoccus sp. MC1627]
MSRISVSTARQTLPEQLDRVEAGEEVSITRHGRVVAVLVRPDVLKARRASKVWDEAERIAGLLDSTRSEPLQRPVISPERAEELADAVRDARSGR